MDSTRHTRESSSGAFYTLTLRNRTFPPYDGNGFYAPLGLVEVNDVGPWVGGIHVEALDALTKRYPVQAPNPIMPPELSRLRTWVAMQYPNDSRGDRPWSHAWQRGYNLWRQGKRKR